MERLLKVDEAATFLGVSVWTLRTWTSQRRVPVVRLGRAVRFRRDMLEELAQQGLPKTPKRLA